MRGQVLILFRNQFQNETMKILILLLFSTIIYGQNIESHHWKNRVLIISGNTKSLDKVEKQFKLFQAKKEELLERRLVIYKCIERTCNYYDSSLKLKELELDNAFNSFEIKLIGLDGVIKYASNKIENADVVFNLIDSMPMRRQEVRNKRKSNE